MSNEGLSLSSLSLSNIYQDGYWTKIYIYIYIHAHIFAYDWAADRMAYQSWKK